MQSTKKQKLESKTQASARDEAVTESFAANAAACLDDLTVTQLRMLLGKHGVPKTKWTRLRKANLLSLAEQITGVSVATRVTAALDQRAKIVEGKAVDNCFGRLASDIVLLLSSFSDLTAVAALSRCSVNLRNRLSLSVKGTPSLVLSNVKSLTVGANVKTKALQALLVRIPKLEYLNMTSDIPVFSYTALRCRMPFAKLEHCVLTGRCTYNSLECLRFCTALVSIRLERGDDPDVYTTEQSTWSFPKLRSLIIIHFYGDTRRLRALLAGCTALETLGLAYAHEMSSSITPKQMNVLYESFGCFSGQLRSLDLRYVRHVEYVALGEFSSLEYLNVTGTLFDCDDLRSFPRRLRSLYAHHGSLAFGSQGDLPELRELGLSLSSDEIEFPTHLTAAFPKLEILSFVACHSTCYPGKACAARIISLYRHQRYIWPNLKEFRHFDQVPPCPGDAGPVSTRFMDSVVTFKTLRPEVNLQFGPEVAAILQSH